MDTTVQMLARALQRWPRILRPGDVFGGYAASPTCIHQPETGKAYLPVVGAKGDLVGLLEFDAGRLDPPIRRIATLLRQGRIVEVQASPLYLYARPALLADASEMLIAASALSRFLAMFPGAKLDIRDLVP